MDPSQLVQVLAACLSESPAAAEETLKQYQTAPGQAGNLLRVAVEESVDEAVRHMASIYFKNLVKRHWVASDAGAADSFQLSDADKTVVHAHLLDCIIRSPQRVQLQLAEALKMIIETDFPHKWPGLLPTLQQYLTSNDQSRIFAGLIGYRWLCRKYQLTQEGEEVELEQVVSVGFPILLQLLQQLLQDTTFSAQAAEAIKTICKCFFYAVYLNVPKQLSGNEAFLGWMTAIHAGLLKPIPKEVQPHDEDDRARWVWWKAKKWLFRLSYRLFMRIRSSSSVTADEKQVAILYSTECLPKFVNAHLQVMADYAAGAWLSPTVLALNLQFLSESLKVSTAYNLMKPHLDGLVANVVFPLTFFTAKDNELWVNDPHEYVRKGYEALETMYDVKVAATNFLHELCLNKPKAQVDKVMGVILQVLNAYAAERTAGTPQPETAARMDGALLLIGCMYAVLRKKKPYKDQLEHMLMTHIAPCFHSPYGFLRAKACWVSGAYADINFSNEANFYSLFEGIIKAMSDPDLPVRVDAGSSLKDFVDKLHDAEKLKTILEPLMNNLFALMREVDSEELVATVETIIENVGEGIVPYAHALCSSLVSTLMLYSDKAAEDDADDDFIAEWAAFGCVRAINTLLSFVDQHPNLFVSLEDVCFPVMERFLGSDGQDMLEDVLEMLTRFTFCLPQISPRLWTLWPKLHAVIKDWGIDFWDSALRPLDNYITKDPERFLTCKQPDYLASVYEMVATSLNLLTDDDEDKSHMEEQLVAAPLLLNVVLQGCKGRVDEWVGQYLTLVISKLPVCKERTLKDALMSVVANAIYYNPILSLGLMHQMGCVGAVFSEWFKMIFTLKKSGQMAYFKTLMDKKASVLALSSLLTVPDSALPPELNAGLSQLTPGILKLLMALKEQQDKKTAEEEEEEDEEEEEEEEEDIEEEGEMDDAEGDAYLKKLEEISKKYAEKSKKKGLDEEDDEDDDDDDFSVDEDFSSPLDPINPYIVFASAFLQVQTSNPGRYQVLLTRVDDGAKVALEGMMAYAQQQMQEQQAAAAAAVQGAPLTG